MKATTSKSDTFGTRTETRWSLWHVNCTRMSRREQLTRWTGLGGEQQINDLFSGR